MTTLRLWIDSSFPEQQASCRWWLYGDDGRLQQQGRSVPRHWPGLKGSGGDHTTPGCELLLTADNASLLQVQLPPGRAPSGDLLRFAVEDQLLDDTDQLHLTLGPRQADGRHAVIAIARRRLDAILASLRPLGLQPERVVVTAQALTAEGDAWPLLLDDQRGTAILPEGWVDFDLDQPEHGLAWLRASDRLDACRTLVPQSADTDLPAALLANPPRPLAATVALDPAALCRRGLNLLHGDYAPRREARFAWRTLLPVARVAAFAAALGWLALLGNWAWWSWRSTDLRSETQALARAALPDVSVIVAPALQVQRALDARRHARGELSDSDLLPLLAPLARFDGLQIDSLSYRDGRLEARLSLPSTLKLAQLRHALRQEGIGSVVKSEGGGSVQLLLTAGELS